MNSWEKHEEEIKKIGFGFAVLKDSNEVVECSIRSTFKCEECLFYEDNYSCEKERLHWLYSDYQEPVVITDDERKLCELLGRGWIARDSTGVLDYYQEKPKKEEYIWDVCVFNVVSISSLFPQCKFEFIKWEDEEPYRVEELIKRR